MLEQLRRFLPTLPTWQNVSSPFKVLFPRPKKKKKHAVLVMDLGTEMMKMSIAVPHLDKGMVEIHASARIRQKEEHVWSGNIIDREGVLETAKELVKQVENEARIQTETMIIGISGELVKGGTVSVDYIREDPKTEITLPELRQMVHKVQWKAYEHIRRELAWETGYSEIDIKLVHNAIVDVRIDGLSVNNPIGYKGRYVEIGVFNAFSPLVYFDAIKNLAQELDKELLSVILEPYALSKAITHTSPHESALFIDVGGGTTDVTLMERGAVIGTKMFGIGGRVFTKRLAHHLDMSYLAAEELKIQIFKGLKKSSQFLKAETLLKEDARTWKEALLIALKELDVGTPLPTKWYISGGSGRVPYILQACRDVAKMEGILLKGEIELHVLTPEDIPGMYDLSKKLHDDQSIGLLALSHLALDMMGDEPVLKKVLRQITTIVAS